MTNTAMQHSAPKGQPIFDYLRDPKYIEEIGTVVAGNIDPKRLARIFYTAIDRNWTDEKGLPKLSKCDPWTIYTAVLECAQLELDPNNGEFWFVPYSSTCTGMLGWKGMIRLPYKYGVVARIDAEVKYQGDEFEYKEDCGVPQWSRTPAHLLGRKKGAVEFAYCHWKLRNGELGFKFADADRIQTAKDAAKTQMVWSKHHAKMARKTAVREAWPFIPKDGIPYEITTAIEDDGRRELEGFTTPRVEIPAHLMAQPARPRDESELKATWDTTATMDPDHDPTAADAP